MRKQNPVMRFFRHLFSIPWHVNCHFSPQGLEAIEQAIEHSERRHAGEIRFVVEVGLHPIEILYRKTPRKRAIELFGRLNVWDTENNNGVLIYLLLADHDVEIIADRGINQYVGNAGWEKICHDMEVLFRQGAFEAGVLQGISQISTLLEQYFPQNGVSLNELTNRPLIL